MNRQKWTLVVVALMLIGSTAVFLNHFRTHQKQGAPGVKTKPLAGSQNLEVILPENVLDYQSESMEVAKLVVDTLPKDTSFGSRIYKAPDRFAAIMNVVLMGTDRTSLHKPQFCLQGQGWRLDPLPSAPTMIPMERPHHYDLPVIKITASKEFIQEDGRKAVGRGIYVYWYVAEDSLCATTSGMKLMWLMGHDLLTKGVMQRWAYVSCFSVCNPGQEEEYFERMKKLIAASVPDFQLTPSASEPRTLTAR
jgi:hypothetical protein